MELIPYLLCPFELAAVDVIPVVIPMKALPFYVVHYYWIGGWYLLSGQGVFRTWPQHRRVEDVGSFHTNWQLQTIGRSNVFNDLVRAEHLSSKVSEGRVVLICLEDTHTS